MVRYQFQIDDKKWADWKRTVPRDKSLEQRIIELIEADRDGRVEAATRDELRSDGAGTIASTRTVDSPIADVVQDWRPGNDLDRRKQRRHAGQAALEFLRERGVAQAQEFRAELEAEHPVDGQSAQTWWTQTARQCLNQAEDAGLVVQDGNEWRWVGDRDD